MGTDSNRLMIETAITGNCSPLTMVENALILFWKQLAHHGYIWGWGCGNTASSYLDEMIYFWWRLQGGAER